MRVFVDTNIIIDFLAERVPFYDAARQLFVLGERPDIYLHTSVVSYSNTAYIVGKQLSPAATRGVIGNLYRVLAALPTPAQAFERAIEDASFSDFEDSLQHQTARHHKMDVIVTRNIKDFTASTVDVMTADAFAARYDN